MSRTALHIVLCLVVTLSAYGQEWKVNRRYRRPVEGGGDSATAVFSFCAGGNILPGGRDVLVATAKGDVIPSTVLYSDPAELTWVAYQSAKAGEKLFVYYGGGLTAGGVSPGTWEPQLSLILKTLPFPNGALDSYRPIAAAARGKLYGMGFVSHIWHADNPYGPSDSYASVYTGYLKIDTQGRYRIFTNSDDASFVLLDGKEAVSWPGEHHATGRQGEHGTDLELTQGLHKIEYYHAKIKGHPLMSLGWVPPGVKGWHPVPESAFLHTPESQCGAPERQEGGPLAAFAWRQSDQIIHERCQFTRVTFENQCRAAPKGGRVEWDYGDGSKGSQAGDHIYLGDGPFECEAKMLDAAGVTADRYKATVRFEVRGDNFTGRNTPQVQEYLRVIEKSDMSKLSRDFIKAAWLLADAQNDLMLIIPLAQEHVKRFGYQGDDWAVADRLAQAYSVKDPAKAVELYGKIAANAPTESDALRTRMERIETTIHKVKDYAKAAEMCTIAARASEARMCEIKMGDLALARGDLEKAEQAYRAVQEKAYRGMDPREIAVKQTSYYETVISLIDKGYLREAREKLIEWELSFPTGKLGGDLTLASARYFQSLGDHQRAIEELTTLTKINPLSPYLPEIQFRMGLSYAGLGENEKARAILDKVVREYPNNRFARQAEEARGRLP